MTAWRRLRRVELRRWRSGQAICRGCRVTLVSASGMEGQPLPTIEPPGTPDTTITGPADLDAVRSTLPVADTPGSAGPTGRIGWPEDAI